MPADPNCIFCKIIAGQIPCFKVYEDDVVIAFLDIGPLVRGHTLVVPKEHHATIMATPPELLGKVNERLPKLAKAVLASVPAKACHVLVNNGTDAMQSVDHLHYHIIPRVPSDSFRIAWNTHPLDKGVAGTLAAAIAAAVK
jgi:histidine triad (HIT) family protein